ncbi:MAG: TldD/PmbA family protein, partial [Methanobacteriota archaeon]
MEDLAPRIVKKAIALGCQDAIADIVTNRSYQIRFAQNEAVISNRWRESTASVFFVYKKRVLASDIKDLSKTDEAVERLVKIAKTSQENPDYAGIAKGPFEHARVRPDPKVLALDDGGKYVEAAIGGALDQGAKECAGSFWKYEDEHSLATSNGVEAHDHRASLYLSIRALVSLESSGHGIACATKLSQFDPEKAGQKAGRIAALAKFP